MPPGEILYTLHVTSLYTNIAHTEGISTIKEMLTTHRQPLDVPWSS